MSLFGKLEDTPLLELLQVLAATRVTGKLRLTGREYEGIIVFRNGNIVYAASSSARLTLGNLLLLEGLVTEDQLSAALDRQHAAKEELRLGGILVEQGAIDEATLTRVVQQQTERVISEFLGWEQGYFKLDRVELEDLGEIEVDAKDFLMREGFRTEDLLSDLPAKIEEFQRLELAAAKVNAAGPSVTTAEAAADLASLKSIMSEIRSPQFTGEISQAILNYAQDIFSRGVLFVTRAEGFGVMGQFGVHSDDGQLEAKLRQLLIPAEAPTILSEVAGRKGAITGTLEDTEWNQKLIAALGGPTAGESTAVPLIVNDRVLLVFYGDEMLGDRRPGWLEELELVVLQAGLAMEKDLLVKRIESYERLRRTD